MGTLSKARLHAVRIASEDLDLSQKWKPAAASFGFGSRFGKTRDRVIFNQHDRNTTPNASLLTREF